MNNLKGNKTTILGILTIGAALIAAAIQFVSNGHVDFAQLGAGITGGIGLIHAADQKQ